MAAARQLPYTAAVDVQDSIVTRDDDMAEDLRDWYAEDQDDTDEDPIPLTCPAPIPPFPADSLPTWMQNMVSAVAEATQTDAAMAATSALAAVSACAGGHSEIEIRPGWREILVLYTATVAESGERKSAVQQAAIRPLLDVEEELAAAGAAARLEAATRKTVADAAAEKARREAASAQPGQRDSKLADAISAAAMAEQIEIPVIPRIFADDATPESIASLLCEQGGRLAVISAEGGIFDVIAGRYSGNVPNMDVFLKGHNGDPLRIDRKSRPPEYVRRPALTLALMIQPDVLKSLAAQRQFRGRGLLARFLYAMPKSKVGRREIAAAPVPEQVSDIYASRIHDLASGMAGWLGDPAILTLTSKAHEALKAVESAVEPTLSDGGELAALKDWGSKYVGAVARIAGILHLAELGSQTGPTTAVNAETVLKAARIGAYFKAAAIKAFLEMGTDPAVSDAAYLLVRIRHLGVDAVSERDLHRASQSRFPKKETMVAAVERLVDHGYLIPVPQQKTGGRPASPRYRVHAAVNQ